MSGDLPYLFESGLFEKKDETREVSMDPKEPTVKDLVLEIVDVRTELDILREEVRSLKAGMPGESGKRLQTTGAGAQGGHLFKAIRCRARRSVEELARLLEISTDEVRGIESGEIMVGCSLLSLYAKKLDSPLLRDVMSGEITLSRALMEMGPLGVEEIGED
jgi:hypothetical protein